MRPSQSVAYSSFHMAGVGGQGSGVREEFKKDIFLTDSRPPTPDLLSRPPLLSIFETLTGQSNRRKNRPNHQKNRNDQNRPGPIRLLKEGAEKMVSPQDSLLTAAVEAYKKRK